MRTVVFVIVMTVAGFAQAAKEPEVVGGSAEVTGDLDKDLVRRVIRRHFNEVKACYVAELARTPGLQGRLVVQFTIVPAGTVGEAKLKTSTLANAPVEGCVLAAVRRWEFPKVTSTVGVTYPFTLKISD